MGSNNNYIYGCLKNIRELESKVGQNLCVEVNSLIGLYIASDIIDEKSGKIFYEAGFEIDETFDNIIISDYDAIKKNEKKHPPSIKFSPSLIV